MAISKRSFDLPKVTKRGKKAMKIGDSPRVAQTYLVAKHA